MDELNRTIDFSILCHETDWFSCTVLGRGYYIVASCGGIIGPPFSLHKTTSINRSKSPIDTLLFCTVHVAHYQPLFLFPCFTLLSLFLFLSRQHFSFTSAIKIKMFLLVSSISLSSSCLLSHTSLQISFPHRSFSLTFLVSILSH